ncbi:MAG TPA: YdcF family protein [Gemmatimonadaceae bacterium]
MARRRGCGSRLFAIFLVAMLAGWLVSLSAVLLAARRDEAQPADAIVVLGAAQYAGRPSPVLRARLDHAVALWKRGLAPRLVLTGGTGVGDTTSEAAVSRRYVRRHGVPDSAILLENRGRTTSQSLHAVAGLLGETAPSSVVLVSDPFHSLRLAIIARRLGLDPHTSPTRTSPISRNKAEYWKYLLSESVKAPLAYLFERSPT